MVKPAGDMAAAALPGRLRVLRTLRLLHSYELLARLRQDSRFFARVPRQRLTTTGQCEHSSWNCAVAGTEQQSGRGAGVGTVKWVARSEASLRDRLRLVSADRVARAGQSRNR